MFPPNIIENEFLQRLLWVIIAAVGVILLVRLAYQVAQRTVSEPQKLYRTRKSIRRTGALVSVVLVIVELSPGMRALVTVLTVVGAGLAIALRQELLSIIGWAHVMLASPYRHGDRIEINGLSGDVIDVRVLRTSLMEIKGWVDADQSTGRIVHFPNNWLVSHAVKNYSRGFNFIWNELPLTVTFQSDWEKARDIMNGFASESAAIVERQAARQIHDLSREFLIHYSILTPFGYVKIVENGVQLTLRYLCEVRNRRGRDNALMFSILEAFKKD